jgi:hypothetical protein
MSSTALPTQSSRPQVWKALPPNPAEFRLGEDAMPWSASPYAQGYMGETSTTNGPDLLGFTPIVDDREKVRTKEMQSLATALMTVDNGFEDQWWYQGSRLVNIAGDLITPTALAARYQAEMASAWPSANIESPITGTADMFSPSQNSMYMVSPISAGPSPVADHPGLKRSLSTRSEELHIR